MELEYKKIDIFLNDTKTQTIDIYITFNEVLKYISKKEPELRYVDCLEGRFVRLAHKNVYMSSSYYFIEIRREQSNITQLKRGYKDCPNYLRKDEDDIY